MKRRLLAVLFMLVFLSAAVSACKKSPPDMVEEIPPSDGQPAVITEEPTAGTMDGQDPAAPGIIAAEAVDPTYETILPPPEERETTEEDIFEFSTLFHGMRSVSGNVITMQDSRTVSITEQDEGYLFSVDEGESHIASFIESELRLPAVALMREGTLVAGSMILPAGDDVAQNIGSFFVEGGQVIAWDAYENQMAAVVSRLKADFREVCELYLFREDGSKILLYSCPMVRYGEEEGLYSTAFDQKGNLYFYDPGGENPASGWLGKTLVFETTRLPGDSYAIDYMGRPRPMADRRYVGLTRKLSGDVDEAIYDCEIKDFSLMTYCEGLYAADGLIMISEDSRSEVFSTAKGYETDRLPAENLLAASFYGDSALMLKFDGGFAIRKFALNGSLRRNIWSYTTGADASAGRFLSGAWLGDNRFVYWIEFMEGERYSNLVYQLEVGSRPREILAFEKSAERIERVLPLNNGMAIVMSGRILYYDAAFNLVSEQEIPLSSDFYGNQVPYTVTDIMGDGSALVYVENGSLYISAADFSGALLIYESAWDIEGAYILDGIFASANAAFSDDEKFVAFNVAGHEYTAGVGVYEIARKDFNFYEGEMGFTWLKGDSGRIYLVEGRDGTLTGMRPGILDILTGQKTVYEEQWLGDISWLDSGRILKYSYGLKESVISVTDARTGRELTFFPPFHATAFSTGVKPSPSGKYIVFHNEFWGRTENLVVMRLQR